MIPSLLVALGGALGSVGRYWVTALATRALGERLPTAAVWATVGINVLGSFAIGLFATLTAPAGAAPASAEARLFIMVGVCGGFTTFSSFSLQTLALARAGAWLAAASNVLLSVALCLLAVFFGHMLALRCAGGARGL